MKIYLISNNILLNGLNYDPSSNLELVRLIRPISSEGEVSAKKISEFKELQNVEKIYASFYSSSISTAKYLAEKLELSINIDENLNDCKVGILGNKNMKMVKGLQDHDFSYKLPSGESLNLVGERINNFLENIIYEKEECAIFTHKRAILGFLLNYAKAEYNLDDNLILSYKDSVVYDDSDSPFDIYEIEINEGKINNIIRL